MPSFNPLKIGNKQKRRAVQLKLKKEKESSRRDERMRRRRLEDKNPQLREQRRAKNVPMTIDNKRVWDDGDEDDAGATLGLSVDVLSSKRRKMEEASVMEDDDEDENGLATNIDLESAADDVEGVVELGKRNEDAEDDDLGSFLGSDSEGDEDDTSINKHRGPPDRVSSEAPSLAASVVSTATLAASVVSTATDLNITPEALVQRYPSLFNNEAAEPKVLITTSINATIHDEARLLTSIFPNSTYIRRTAHFHSYKYSVREISKYAAGRDFTCVIVLNEERKRPKGLDIVHLPDGPMFHFSISNWIPGDKLPGHGNPTNHYPELILNGFRTPLGMLAAHLFKSLFPPRPEIHGRQVVTLHNQRDYIFFRRHRYVFRDKRASEKSIQGADGKPVKGVETIRAGLQELGPRFTLKLRRIDTGIQRASGQEWEWKAHDEKMRTRFSL